MRNLTLSLFLAFAGCAAIALPASNFVDGGGSRGMHLHSLYFNLYTDSLKPVLNYYVNVEGQTPNGNFLPLDTNDVILWANWGTMQGNEWVIPKVLLHDSVVFAATSRQNVKLTDTVVIWLQKWKDPRDEPGYTEPELEDSNQEPRNRRR